MRFFTRRPVFAFTVTNIECECEARKFFVSLAASFTLLWLFSSQPLTIRIQTEIIQFFVVLVHLLNVFSIFSRLPEFDTMTSELPELSREEVCWIYLFRFQLLTFFLWLNSLLKYRNNISVFNFFLSSYSFYFFQVEKVVELYKETFQHAIRVVSATIRPSPKSGSYFVTSQWSQRSLERGSPMQIMRTILTDSSFTYRLDVNAVDISHW